MGIGAANLFAGLFSGFPVSTSGSRTAVAEQSGAKTQLTGVVAGLLVLAMLLFVPGLVQNLPQPALAAIVITAAFSLFDLKALQRLYTIRKSEFILAVDLCIRRDFCGRVGRDCDCRHRRHFSILRTFLATPYGGAR